MSRLVTMIVRRYGGRWWELRTSEGDPPTERVGLFIYRALIVMIRQNLGRKR